MLRRNCVFLLAAALCLSVGFAGSEKSFAKGKDLTPQELMADHLKSIGTPEALAGIRNRGISGIATVQFIQGGTGKMIGQSLMVSAGNNLSIIMKFDAPEYPKEHFAFNGGEVTVSNITPGQRSPLGDFIYRYNGLVKEGLIGGIMSLGWPLLDIGKSQATLRVDQAKVDGRELYEVEYIPKRSMNDVKVKLFFDPETFHHVRTEYRLRVRGEQSLQAGQTLTRGATDSVSKAGPITRAAGIQDSIQDSHYLLVEKFDKFKEVKFKEGNLTLPQNYTIDYSVEGTGSTFLAHWNIDNQQWIQNGKIDSSFFEAR